MESLWNDAEAAQFSGALGPRVYTSRLLGRDRSLVLHGGGNTSVKIRETNILGQEEEILYVKGSGWDLETIEAAGFSPVRLQHLLGLSRLERLSDTQMAAELKSNMTNAAAPAPSVEAILHAVLPHRYVDHTHADALIAVTNTADGEARVREIYGDTVVVIPYVMPGFKLARVCAQLFPAQSDSRTVGMVLLNHGLFSFGNSARESYERMIELADRAERYLIRQGAWYVPARDTTTTRSDRAVQAAEVPAYDTAMIKSGRAGQAAEVPAGESAIKPDHAGQVAEVPAREMVTKPDRAVLAALRQAISDAAGAPMIVATQGDEQIAGFVSRPNLPDLALQGPATPDHVIRTKVVPQIGINVSAYANAYRAYFVEHAAGTAAALTMLDPAPRVVLSPAIGMCTVGRTARDAAIAAEIYRHTITIIQRADLLGGYRALAAADLFEMEYWDLEQAKVRRQGSQPAFTGEIAVVTGAASGIGKACVEALLSRGAAVAALDINPSVADLSQRADLLGLCCDVTSDDQVAAAIDAVVQAFGGIDMLILNAGIFPAGKKIQDLPLSEWDRVMRINLDANLVLMREAHPLLKAAPRHGRVAIIGSKNVPAPGPGAAAYSASKAALTQLARVAALEWGADGIRVNVLHPNAVFDTGIWTEEVLRARAASYKLTVEEYRRNNLLHLEVTSKDVAELAAELCGPLFSRTTGAQIPVDGGNERVI